MPLDFTGEPTWRETCTGPSNTDDGTGESVTDMGTQLADRTLYLLHHNPIVKYVEDKIDMYSNATLLYTDIDPGIEGMVLPDFGGDWLLVVNTALPIVDNDGTNHIHISAVGDDPFVSQTLNAIVEGYFPVVAVLTVPPGTYDINAQAALTDVDTGALTIDGNYTMTVTAYPLAP